MKPICVKPSAYSPCTSEIMKTIIKECFDEKYISVIIGGRAENTCLLNEHFDYIFFTGSQTVGKEVMKHASVNLTPVTLELGGKTDMASLKIEPTVIDNVNFEDAVMQEEIFRPLLPILTYDSLEQAVCKINSLPHPLA